MKLPSIIVVFLFGQVVLAQNGNNLFLDNAKYLYAKTSSGTNTRTLGINSSNNLYIGSVDASVNNVFFNLNGQNRLTINGADGNFGIGLTNPNVPLHVRRNQSGWLQEIAGTSPVPGEFVGLKLLSGYAGETGKWVGIAAISESQYSNQTGLGLFTGHEERFRISQNGNVGIGTSSPDSKLAVNGNIHAKEVKVNLTGWPDYVFTNNYDLPTLEEVKRHIQEKRHLINIPSASEVKAHGIELGEMNKLLLEKIEELTLYTIQQEEKLKKMELLEREVSELKRMIIELQNQ